jgi:hypothetical protein
MKLAPAKKGRTADIRFDEIVNDAARVLVSRQEFADEIGRLWRISQKHFLQIGRYLNQAKDQIPHGEFEEMIQRDLPFTPAIGRQLRTVALFVDGGAIDVEKLPDSYSTLYQIATLSAEERQLAEEQRLIRPTVTRKEIETLKKSRMNAAKGEPVWTHKALDAELKKLRGQRDVLDSRIAALQRQRDALG